MTHLFADQTIWLPFVFAGLMGLSILIYVVLDGFDLGVGLLFPFADSSERDRMVASIGPFWDANETWLVLAIGLLLVAFPSAHGAILTALYLPVAIMLAGLTLRGVAFEFRAKAPLQWKPFWDGAFCVGSLMAALSQGFMLGMYVMGLTWTWIHAAFGLLTGVFLAVAFSFIGACWIVLKSDEALQIKAVGWARGGIWGLVLGLAAVSLTTPLVSARIFDKWFSYPEVIWLSPLPILSTLIIVFLWWMLRQLPHELDHWAWIPFTATTLLFVLGFGGMAYSFYPFVVPDRLTIFEAASSPESLWIILIGVMIVLPLILAYTVMSYTIFRGKASDLRYD